MAAATPVLAQALISNSQRRREIPPRQWRLWREGLHLGAWAIVALPSNRPWKSLENAEAEGWLIYPAQFIQSGQNLHHLAMLITPPPRGRKRWEMIVETGAGALWTEGASIESSEEVFTVNRFRDGARLWGNAKGRAYETVEKAKRWPANFSLIHERACQPGRACGPGCAVSDYQRNRNMSRIYQNSYWTWEQAEPQTDWSHGPLPIALWLYQARFLLPPLGLPSRLLLGDDPDSALSVAALAAGWGEIVGLREGARLSYWRDRGFSPPPLTDD